MEEEPGRVNLRTQLRELLAEDTGYSRGHDIWQRPSKQNPLLDAVSARLARAARDALCLLLGRKFRRGVGFFDNFGNASYEDLEAVDGHD